MIDISDIPAQAGPPRRERGRLQVEGERADDNGWHTLLGIHKADGCWAIPGLGAPGVRLPGANMVALPEKILARAR